MNQRMQWVWAAALLLSPLAVSAQTPKTDAGSTPPVVAPAAPAVDDGAWLAEVFGPGDALESAFDAPDGTPLAYGDMADAPDGPGGPGPMAFDDGGRGDGPGQGPHGRMGGPGGRGMMMRRGLGMRLEALDLTDAQRTKLRDIHEAVARKNIQRRADMELARMDLRKLMRAETPSASAVNAQIDKISRLQAEGMKAKFDALMQARAVLTPDQLKKLRSGPGAMRMPRDTRGQD
jgi:Spy/CpxP family protein refolding chaperone